MPQCFEGKRGLLAKKNVGVCRYADGEIVSVHSVLRGLGTGVPVSRLGRSEPRSFRIETDYPIDGCRVSARRG